MDLSKSDDLTWMHVFVRVGLNAATHPIEYAKILIQIGHEPLAPYKSWSIFCRETMFYSSVFSYVAHIKKRDGISGCFRGLTPKLSGNIISGFTFQKVTECIKFKKIDEKTEDEEQLDMHQRTQIFIQSSFRESAGRVAAVIVSQPFHVIAVRCMAEYIGEDGIYTNMFSSFGVIYREEGIVGFFAGLIPRLICDLGSLWAGNTLIHIINNYIIEDRDVKIYIAAAFRFLASSLVYRFQVVSNCMAVSGSGLAAGSPPHMPAHENWVDCYRHLEGIRGLTRGSSLLWRTYTGPTIYKDGNLAIPSVDMFKSII